MKLRWVALVWSLSMVFAIAANAESREHVVCYQAKPAKKACSSASANAGAICSDDANCVGGVCEKQPKFPKGLFAKLDDDTDPQSVGEDKTFEVKKLKQLCVPVDVNGLGVEDPDTFWVTYQVKQAKKVCSAGVNQDLPCKDDAECPGSSCVEIAKFDGKAATNANILVEDQFTNIRVAASKVDLLMVPASLCDGDNDATCVSGANAAPTGEEHYKCYKAKATKKVCSLGSPNELLECKKDDECGFGGLCVKLDKFAKGVNATATDSVPGFNNGRTFDIAKLTHICKAVAKTPLLPTSGAPEGPVNSAARLLCYKSKGSKGQCAAGVNAGGACKKDEECPGSNCAVQNKFDKANPDGQGLYVNDQFDLAAGATPTEPGDYHRLNAAKEEMFCLPACEAPDEILSFTNNVVRAVTLSIPSTGNPGDGQDVDNNAATCQPAGCSGGIDNVLGTISGLIPALNTALQDTVTDGSVNIVLEIDEFANGAQLANGYLGDLDSPAGCTDVNDGGQVCNYKANGVGIDKSCAKTAEIEFPITVSGLPGSPAAISGGGVGTDLAFNLPLGDSPLPLTIRNVKVGASVVHTAGPGTITGASGALGGAISQRELKATINDLPEGNCDGGPNSGDACTLATATADCGAGNPCNTMYLGGFDKAFVILALDSFLVRDIDLDGAKSCEGGGNDGEACTTDADCPDQVPPQSPACDNYDAHSVGLKFTAIDAAISGSSCDKATCSLY